MIWLRRIKEEKIRLYNVFQEKREELLECSEKDNARMREHFQGKIESVDKEYPMLSKDFGVHQERQEAITKELVLQNRTLWVGLSLLCLYTGFLIFQ